MDGCLHFILLCVIFLTCCYVISFCSTSFLILSVYLVFGIFLLFLHTHSHFQHSLCKYVICRTLSKHLSCFSIIFSFIGSICRFCKNILWIILQFIFCFLYSVSYQFSIYLLRTLLLSIFDYCLVGLRIFLTIFVYFNISFSFSRKVITNLLILYF